MCNQVTFQNAVYEASADGSVLPLKYFPTGRIYFELMPKDLRDKVYIVHNNFIVGKEKKIQRFKYFELWFSESSGKLIYRLRCPHLHTEHLVSGRWK